MKKNWFLKIAISAFVLGMAFVGFAVYKNNVDSVSVDNVSGTNYSSSIGSKNNVKITLNDGWSGKTTSFYLDNTKKLPNLNMQFPTDSNFTTRDGYLLDGYFTGENGAGERYYKGAIPSLQNKINSSITLYANWKEGSFTYSFEILNDYFGDKPTFDKNSRVTSYEMVLGADDTFEVPNIYLNGKDVSKDWQFTTLDDSKIDGKSTFTTGETYTAKREEDVKLYLTKSQYITNTFYTNKGDWENLNEFLDWAKSRSGKGDILEGVSYNVTHKEVYDCISWFRGTYIGINSLIIITTDTSIRKLNEIGCVYLPKIKRPGFDLKCYESAVYIDGGYEGKAVGDYAVKFEIGKQKEYYLGRVSDWSASWSWNNKMKAIINPEHAVITQGRDEIVYKSFYVQCEIQHEYKGQSLGTTNVMKKITVKIPIWRESWVCRLIDPRHGMTGNKYVFNVVDEDRSVFKEHFKNGSPIDMKKIVVKEEIIGIVPSDVDVIHRSDIINENYDPDNINGEPITGKWKTVDAEEGIYIVNVEYINSHDEIAYLPVECKYVKSCKRVIK